MPLGDDEPSSQSQSRPHSRSRPVSHADSSSTADEAEGSEEGYRGPHTMQGGAITDDVYRWAHNNKRKMPRRARSESLHMPRTQTIDPDLDTSAIKEPGGFRYVPRTPSTMLSPSETCSCVTDDSLSSIKPPSRDAHHLELCGPSSTFSACTRTLLVKSLEMTTMKTRMKMICWRMVDQLQGQVEKQGQAMQSPLNCCDREN